VLLVVAATKVVPGEKSEACAMLAMAPGLTPTRQWLEHCHDQCPATMCPMTWPDEDHSDASGRARRQYIREFAVAIAAICGLTAVLIVALQLFLEWAR
jgi:hypothetical protein